MNWVSAPFCLATQVHGDEQGMLPYLFQQEAHANKVEILIQEVRVFIDPGDGRLKKHDRFCLASCDGDTLY